MAYTSMVSEEELAKRFAYHTINGDAKLMIEGFREEYLALAHLINERIPNGREKATVLTKLEEACFWTVASIARDPNYHLGYVESNQTQTE